MAARCSNHHPISPLLTSFPSPDTEHTTLTTYKGIRKDAAKGFSVAVIAQVLLGLLAILGSKDNISDEGLDFTAGPVCYGGEEEQ